MCVEHLGMPSVSARTRPWPVLLAPLLILALFGPASSARASVHCTFTGLSPGYHVMPLNLPQGTNYLGLGIGGRLATSGVTQGDSWHLSQGIIIFDAATLALHAWWIEASGGNIPRVVIQSGNLRIDQPIPSPDGFNGDYIGVLPAGLPPGSYLAVTFGVGSGTGILGPTTYKTTLSVGGNHDCETNHGDGELFDYNQNDFSGTQISTPFAGYGANLQLGLDLTRHFNVGLLFTGRNPNVVGSSRLDYSTPSGAGTVSEDIKPFVSSGGTHRFTLNYTGLTPVTNIAGISFDLN